VVDTVASVAEKRGASRAQVALAWLLSKPVVSAPILGVTSGQQLQDALGAFSLQLTPEEIEALEAPYEPHSIAGH